MLDSSKEYLKACKLTEAYISFLEKLSYSSVNCDQNLQKLVNLKKKIYTNIQSRRKVEEALSDVLDPIYIPIASQNFISNTPLNSMTSDALSMNTTPQNSYKTKEILSHRVSTNTHEKLTSNIPTSSFSDAFQNIVLDEAPSWCSLSNTDQLLSKLNTSLHFDGNRISNLLNSFTSTRTFDQANESVFYALCTGFFERHVLYKFHQLRSSLSLFLYSKLGKDEDIGALSEYLDTQFSLIIKNATPTPQGEKEIIKRLYDALASNFNLYNSCALTFKKIISKILEKKGLDSTSRKMSFQWMNEVENADKAFYEELVSVLECNLNFYVLSSIKFNEFSFKLTENVSAFSLGHIIKSINHDINILIDKSLNWSHVLYFSKGSSSSFSNASPTFKKSKQKSFSPDIYRDNKPKDDMLPSAINLEVMNKKNSKIFHEVGKGDYYISHRHKKSNPGYEAMPTLQVNFSRDHSKSFESNKNQIESKDSEKSSDILNQYSVLKTETSLGHTTNNNLTKKHTDSTVNKPSYLKYFQNPTSLADKIMEEIHQKVKAEKEKSFSPSLNPIPSQDQYIDNSPISGHTRNKSDAEDSFKDKNKQPFDLNYYQTGNFNTLPMSLDKHFGHMTKDFGVPPMTTEKQMVLPSNLKSKVQSCNKMISHNDDEFSKFVSNHLCEEDLKTIKSALKAQYGSSLSPYDSMMERTFKKENILPTISATMQMDN